MNVTDIENPIERDERNASAWTQAHRRELDKESRFVRAAETRWGWARLLTFFAAAGGWIPLRDTPALAWPVIIGGLVLFAGCVVRHRRIRGRRIFGERLLATADESLRRCGGRVELIRSWQRPADPIDADSVVPTGLEPGPVAALSDQECEDLDLYAPPVGVYGLLNRTSTAPGARRLRDILEQPCLSINTIAERQAAVRWLADHPAERVRLMAAAAGLRGQDAPLDVFVRTVRNARPLPWPVFARVLRWWSAPSTLFAVASIVLVAGGSYTWIYGLLGLMGVNGLALIRIRKGLQEAVTPWRKLRPTADALWFAAQQAALDLPSDTPLAKTRATLAAVAAEDVLPSLGRRLAWTDSGGMMHAICNHIIFYDVHVAHAVLNRVLPRRDAIIEAVGALADLEALNSLACFAFEQPVTCDATPTSELRLEIVEGYHPLIPPGEAVANDMALTPTERTWIITGSNMAGKSTFLRMVGVNVLLAQIGATPTARKMTLSPHRLLTDLRIKDSLAKHESYFLAEVRQLRRMLVPEDDGAVVLGLIDEPFRGTNSRERIAAGMAVVRHLIDSPHFVLVATHEHQLTALADHSAARNHHFREDLAETGPVFDYRLRSGPATTRNALRVLEREGYPADLVERAKRYMADQEE